MKKDLLTFNVIFYAIQYSVALLYAGFWYGATYLLRYPEGLERLVIPGVHLIFLIIGIRLLRGREYYTEKNYCAMAIATLVYTGLDWASRLVGYRGIEAYTHLNNVVYPAVIAAFSVVIAAFYFICAVRTRKEYLRAAKERAKELPNN